MLQHAKRREEPCERPVCNTDGSHRSHYSTKTKHKRNNKQIQ